MVSGEMTSLNNSASSGRKSPSMRRRRDLLSQNDRILFLQTHNKYRNDVGQDDAAKIPTAAKMMKMYWSAQLEASAISRSSKCHVGKRNVTSQVFTLIEFTKALNQYGNTTGHSYFAAAYKPSPSEVLEYFANESLGFSYNKRRGGLCTGRALCRTYTQLVWESSFLVGCGYAKCDNFYVTTCHYLPTGNEEGMKFPFQDGEPCSLCGSDGMHDFTECEDRLCVPLELCSPVKECAVADTENCLCSEADYGKIVRRMLKDVCAIHAGPPLIVYGLLLPLVAILLGHGVQLGYDDPGLRQQQL